MDLSEKTIIQEYVYNGRFISVRDDKVELPDKSIAAKIVVEHRPAVGVVPIDNDGNIVFVRQYRYAVEETTIEVPAGCVDDRDSDLESAAKRELMEEIGYEPGRLIPIGKLYPTPGYVTEVIHLFIAKDLVPGQLDCDPDEFIEVERHSMDEAIEMVMRGDICDAKTQIALFKAREYLKENE